MSKKKIAVATLSLVLAGVVGANCFAGNGWSGNRDYGTAGMSGGGSSAGSHNVFWFHYKYVGGAEMAGQSITLVPQYDNPDKKPQVDGMCAANDVGFWTLALATDGQAKGDKKLDDISAWYRNEVSLLDTPDYPRVDTVYLNQYIGAWNSSTYFYEGTFAPYDTLSFNHASTSISYDKKALAGQLFYKRVGDNYKRVYENDKIASSESEIIDSYRNYLRRIGSADAGKSDSEIKQLMVDNTVYAFCSFDNDQSTNLKSKTKISVTTDSSEGSRDAESGDWNKTDTNDDVLEIRGAGSVTISSWYKLGRDAATFATNRDGGIVKTKASSNPSASPLPLNSNRDLPAFNIGVSETAFLKNGDGVTVDTSELTPNTVYTFCASTSQPNKITVSGSDQSYEGQSTSGACVKIKSVPVVAAIDSETTLTLTDRSGETYSQSSGVDTSGNISYGEVNYGYQSLKAEWSFDLSSSNRCLESKFDGKNCTEDYGTNSSFNVGYKRNGAIFNDSDSLTATLSSGNGYRSTLDSVTKDYSLLPGETINSDDSKEGVKHSSGVHTDGSKANKAQDESSSMSFEVKAKDVNCSINDQPIGLGHPDNYGRMSVVTNDISRQVTVGDGASAMDNRSNPLWLKETDSVTINYEACIGEQIKKDKESGVSDWNAAIGDNAVLGVETTDDLLDSTHYSGTSNAVDRSSTNGKSIAADEILGDTITSHIARGYQFTGSDSVSTHNARIGNVGHKIFNDYKISSSKTATAQINIPYNYILRPAITPGSVDILTIGDNVAFELSIEKKGRENTKLGGEYETKSIKPETRAKYLTFKLSTGTSLEEFQNKADTFATLDGDQTGNLEGILSSNYNIQADSATDISFDGIANGTKISKNWDNNSASDDYNKLCVAVAVYPADSHNSRESKIDTGNQDNALMQGAGDGAFTRIAVSCKTVGKYPTASVEGNGVIAKGSANGHSTRYAGRDFGSWSEYGLVANNVSSFASGASLAYMNAQTGKNFSVNPADAGKKKDQMDAPQTFGNMNSSNVGLNNEGEATTYYSTAKSFAEAIKASFFNEEPDGNSAIAERSASGVKTYVNTNFGSSVTIDALKAAEINSRTDGQVIIYSRGDIRISNAVEELNAILIADGKVDTCAEADQGSNGNIDLLDNCYNPLVVNGAVYSENSIVLDRVYGGGSERDMNLNGDNLVRRAEIFNYDPATVAWSYSFTNHSQALITTYIQEISTRY